MQYQQFQWQQQLQQQSNLFTANSSTSPPTASPPPLATSPSLSNSDSKLQIKNLLNWERLARKLKQKNFFLLDRRREVLHVWLLLKRAKDLSVCFELKRRQFCDEKRMRKKSVNPMRKKKRDTLYYWMLCRLGLFLLAVIVFWENLVPVLVEFHFSRNIFPVLLMFGHMLLCEVENFVSELRDRCNFFFGQFAQKFGRCSGPELFLFFVFLIRVEGEKKRRAKWGEWESNKVENKPLLRECAFQEWRLIQRQPLSLCRRQPCREQWLQHR